MNTVIFLYDKMELKKKLFLLFTDWHVQRKKSFERMFLTVTETVYV